MCCFVVCFLFLYFLVSLTRKKISNVFLIILINYEYIYSSNKNMRLMRSSLKDFHFLLLEIAFTGGCIYRMSRVGYWVMCTIVTFKIFIKTEENYFNNVFVFTSLITTKCKLKALSKLAHSTVCVWISSK